MNGDLLRAALADRYTIERELGRGGNATVYLAHDLKHDRQVALKVVQPDVAESVKAERFLREIRIAAKLTHPHILPLYDSGEVDGVLYYVMPYVEGESLRDRLSRERQLPVDDALRITRDVASALGEAHGQGVVHRDIKPENILLTKSGHAVVADFGIARALTAAGGGAGPDAGAVGTPAYMSPEQASGPSSPGARPASVDGRSDIYSLGCVLYEMLVGHPPYAGHTAQEILARHALDPIPTVRAARPGVPRQLERAVAKALAKAPADRFATAAQFAGALAGPRRHLPVYVAVGLLVLVAGGVVLRQTLFRPPAEQSVAVLPFVNLSGDTAQEYFSDGVTEELINALTKIHGLQVPARTSSFAFKGKNADIREIGRQLNVATVLEGSIRRSEGRLRITAQLIKVADGYNMWSETYDRELRDVLAVQEDISRTITSALRVTLAPGESTALAPHPPANVAAHDLYLRGRFFWNRRTRDGIAKAIQYFQQAIAQDSAYALAYSGLSDAYAEAVNRDVLPDTEAYPQAEAAALKALALDESLAEAHAALGKIRARYHGDLQGAEREFQRAIALNPKYSFAHTWYALFVLSPAGRREDAVREATLGAQLEPLVPAMHGMLGNVLYDARRYDRSIEEYRKAIEMAPDLAGAHAGLGTVYLAKGMLDEAIAELQRSMQVGGNRNATTVAWLATAYARAHRQDEALRLVAELERRSKDERVWNALALLYAGLGAKDRALEALEHQVATGRGVGLFSDPVFDPLRSEPRFRELVKRAGLAETAPAP